MNLISLQIKKIQDNRILTTLNDTFKFAIFLLIFVLVFSWSVNNVPFLERYDFYTIRTNSMEPVIGVGDLAVFDNNFNLITVHPGDIIAFEVDLNSDGVDEVVVHYLYQKVQIDGVDYIRTIPNVSTEPDPWTLGVDKVVGVYKFHVMGVGKIFQFASSWIGRIVLFVDVILISVLFDLVSPKDGDKKGKKKDKKNKEDNIEEKEKVD